MESNKVKLFIGGISMHTNEDQLREYFSAYGEVVEAFIVKDRTTGRPRGFGFVVFADSTAAERVVAEEHKIDGRVVKAEMAVPRDDLQALNRTAGGSRGAPTGSSLTKKIFVGGLAPTVTDSDMRRHFEQFGTITDAMVMYDHYTGPRGFGFITYDSEDAVDKVLLKKFHDLDGKKVEVKRAVPKDGPTVRSPIVNFSRRQLFLGNHMPSSSIGSRMNPRIGGIHSLGTNIEQGRPNLSYNESMNYGNSILTHGRGFNPYLGATSGRFSSPMAYGSYGPFGLNFGGGNSRRINVTSAGSLPYSLANAPYERGYTDIYGGDNDTTWRPASSGLDGWSSFDFGRHQ